LNIEIHKPELEALIRQQIQTGAFETVEDVLLHALSLAAGEPTGAGIVAAMQACPVPDFEFEFEGSPMSVREVSL
jgi:hypothetical protein